MSLASMQPTATVHLFPGLSAELLALLRQLSPYQWTLPTICAPWTVKDLVAHLLGGNLGRLSFQRDHLHRHGPQPIISSNMDLTAFINEQNAAWVHAAHRISPPLLVDFLAVTDSQLATFFESLPMEELTGVAVAWAGETRSANWFDIGREYTEKWFHQQQIREAVGAPGLVERHWLFPVIELCLRALPFTYHMVEAPDGTTINLRITGVAGGIWSLVRRKHLWKLYAGEADRSVTQVEFSDDTAWRLFSKGLDRAALSQRIGIEGNTELGATILDVVAIMA